MAAEILGDDDVGRELRPGLRDLDVGLLEDRLALLVGIVALRSSHSTVSKGSSPARVKKRVISRPLGSRRARLRPPTASSRPPRLVLPVVTPPSTFPPLASPARCDRIAPTPRRLPRLPGGARGRTLRGAGPPHADHRTGHPTPTNTTPRMRRGGQETPEMREAPVHPRPPSRIWVLHPASSSLPPNDRLFLETPQAVKGTCLIPGSRLYSSRKGVSTGKPQNIRPAWAGEHKHLRFHGFSAPPMNPPTLRPPLPRPTPVSQLLEIIDFSV